MPKPEQNLWKSLKQYLPKKTHVNRIENRSGSGMPDVYLVMDGVACFVELKVINKNKVKISEAQTAWHLSHARCGGVSFFLLRGARDKDALLYKSADCLALCGPRLTWPEPIIAVPLPLMPEAIRNAAAEATAF